MDTNITLLMYIIKESLQVNNLTVKDLSDSCDMSEEEVQKIIDSPEEAHVLDLFRLLNNLDIKMSIKIEVGNGTYNINNHDGEPILQGHGQL